MAHNKPTTSAVNTPNVELSVAVVCASNMNRSMEAHNFLRKKGFHVRSFGSGDRVRLPGVRCDKPNVYSFGTKYDDIYKDLLSKNKKFYTENGLLQMLERNREIKSCPERFQDCDEQFDIIVTVEERIYDTVIEHLLSKKAMSQRPVHVINVDIEDSLEDAIIGAFLITDMLNLLSKSKNLNAECELLLSDFQICRRKHVTHSVQYY